MDYFESYKKSGLILVWEKIIFLLFHIIMVFIKYLTESSTIRVLFPEKIRSVSQNFQKYHWFGNMPFYYLSSQCELHIRDDLDLLTSTYCILLKISLLLKIVLFSCRNKTIYFHISHLKFEVAAQQEQNSHLDI